MRTGFKNEKDNENYFALKELTDKVWKLLECSDFTNEEIQNTFTYELHKMIGSLYKIQEYEEINIGDKHWLSFKK